MFRGPLRRSDKGDFEIHLSQPERRLLASLVLQLRNALQVDAGAGGVEDPALRRLFPTAYPENDDQELEYRSMVHDDLLARRRAALETMESTLAATRLDEEALLAWMGAVNDLRLVLGTRLDVSEDSDLEPDPDDPDGPALAVYGYLGFLLESMVSVLSE